MKGETHCGYVAIVGRPNVGKSTLLNHILGQKLSITSRKPQTTQHSILGIHTADDVQAVFIDTPGLHQHYQKNAANRHMNRVSRSVLDDVDLVLFVVEALHWGEEEQWIARLLHTRSIPVISVINKTDKLKHPEKLLPFIEKITSELSVLTAVPVSALTGNQLPELLAEVGALLPESPFHFPQDQFTDKSERFLAAEIIREKIVRQLGRELPYAIAVEIESFTERPEIMDIAALIYTEREGQKAIVVGKGGERLKKIGIQARPDLERMLGKQVMLKLWVKVRQGWSDDDQALKSLWKLT